MTTARWVVNDSAANPIFNLSARSAAPTSASEGDIYLDDGTNTTSTDIGWMYYNGAAWEDLGGGAGGADADAIHDNVAAEISAITQKVTPVIADVLLIEDSEDSFNKKYIEIGDLPAGGGGTMDDFLLAGDTGTPETVADGNTLSVLGGTGIDTVVSATDTLTVAIDSTVATLTGAQTLANKILSQLQLILGGFKAIFTHSNSADRTYTLPNYDGTLATVAGTETFTNKTIDADGTGNVITNIGSSEVKAELITGLTADASPVAADDYVMTYDASASALKKVLLEDLPTGGGSNVSYAIMRHEEANGVNAGATTLNTWNACALNTESYDPDSIVSIASNQFTPISGTYKINVKKMARVSGNSAVRLYNVTGAAAVKRGSNEVNQGTGAIASTPELAWIFTANGTDAYRFDLWVSVSNAAGLGVAISTGDTEVYLEAVLEKIA